VKLGLAKLINRGMLGGIICMVVAKLPYEN